MTDLVSLAIGLALAVLVIRLVSRLKKPALPSERAASGAEAVVPSAEDPEAFIAQIPSLAAFHIQKSREMAGGEPLGYDEASLRRIDGMIDAAWGGEPPTFLQPVVQTFGSYVGETIRTLQGGHWAYDEEFGYHLTEVGGVDLRVFPFAKVEKRFLNGDEDSISFYYDAITRLLEQERAS